MIEPIPHTDYWCRYHVNTKSTAGGVQVTEFTVSGLIASSWRVRLTLGAGFRRQPRREHPRTPHLCRRYACRGPGPICTEPAQCSRNMVPPLRNLDAPGMLRSCWPARRALGPRCVKPRQSPAGSDPEGKVVGPGGTSRLDAGWLREVALRPASGQPSRHRQRQHHPGHHGPQGE